VNLDSLAELFFRIGSKGKDRPLAEIERKYLLALPFVVFVTLVSAAFEGASIGLIIPLLTVMLPGGGMKEDLLPPLRWVAEQAIAISPSHPIEVIGGFILLLMLVKGVVVTAGWLAISRIDGFAQADVRNAIAGKFLRVPYSFFIVQNYSRLLNIISTDAWRTGEAIQAIYGIAGATAASIVLGSLALYTNWQLFLIVILGAVIARIFQRLLAKRVAKISERVTQVNEAMGEQMLMTIDFARMIRLFGQQERTRTKFEKASEDVRQTTMESDIVHSYFGPVMEVVQSALFIIVLIAAKRSGMSVPEIIAFLALQYRLQPQILAISQGLLDMTAISASVRETEWVLSQADAVPDNFAHASLPAISAPIRFQNVDFLYPDDQKQALFDVTCAIHPGRATALIGRSGSGKSTLINLLTRLIEPNSGTILHGDTTVDAYNADRWRSRIALAGQDIELAQGTVAENIAYGCDEISHADIEEAARLADAHDFIMAMGGYDAPLSNYGSNLSGGQRQRVSLARALARRPDLLILDEATNAVDGISEHIIITLLTEHRRFGTAIVISHRRSTLNACQDGIVIDAGRIVEAGPLRQLDFYHRMEASPDLGGDVAEL
jgi:subfamily B ATP-binding cassette protein MsbA